MQSSLLWMLQASRRYGHVAAQSDILELNAGIISNYGIRDQTDRTMKRSGAIFISSPSVNVSFSPLTRGHGKTSRDGGRHPAQQG
jgi:hypothetical protein